MIIKSTGARQHTIKQFIIDLLRRGHRPYTIDEIYHAFKEARHDILPASIRGRLNSLTYEGRISRIARATYAPVGYEASNEAPPTIPSLRPAAIEPQWENGRLTLPNASAKSDIDTPTLLAAFGALRDELTELAEDASGLHNIDQRPVRYLRRLMEEIAQVSRVLKTVTRCDKLNVAAIGNIVPQLHVHIVARRKDDPLWPKPVWGFGPPRAGEAAAFAQFVAAVREGLGLT
jgi:HIT domain